MPNEDFKYLVKEFSSGDLETLKQKGAYPYEYMTSFKNLMKKTVC